MLSDRFVNSGPAAANHLEGLVSRDYYAPVTRSITETMMWQGAVSGGFVGDIANSFSVLLGRDRDRLDEIQNFDFCHGPGDGRRPRFSVATRKLAGSDIVEKLPVRSGSEAADEDGVTQDLSAQPFFTGQLLSAQWLRDLIIFVRREEFEQALNTYYTYLKNTEERESLTIDLLPINIMVRGNGDWAVFDQEWRVAWPVTREYVLFRALLTFIVSNWVYLREFLKWLELQTVQDFVEYGFHANQIHLSEHLSGFIEQEERFQRAIASDPQSVDVQQMLDTVFDFDRANLDGQSPQIYPRLWWRNEEQEAFDPSRSTSLAIDPTPIPVALRFDVAATGSLAAIRLDPFDIRKPDEVGFFRISALRLLLKKSTDSHQVVWSVEGDESVARLGQATAAAFTNDGEAPATWIALTDFPSVEVTLPTPIPLDSDQRYIVEVEMAATRTAEYVLAYNHCIVQSMAGEKRAERAHRNLISMKMIGDYERRKLMGEVVIAERNARSHVEEIEAIKSSRSFRLGSRIVGLGDKLHRLVRRDRS